MTQFTITGTPVSKPRMTRSDVWKKRKCVMNFRAWADTCRAAAIGHCTADAHAITLDFALAPPPSAPKSKLKDMFGQSHRVRPDVDNLAKAVLDALFENDSGISSLNATKRYITSGELPHVEVTIHQRPMDLLG